MNVQTRLDEMRRIQKSIKKLAGKYRRLADKHYSLGAHYAQLSLDDLKYEKLAEKHLGLGYEYSTMADHCDQAAPTLEFDTKPIKKFLRMR